MPDPKQPNKPFIMCPLCENAVEVKTAHRDGENKPFIRADTPIPFHESPWGYADDKTGACFAVGVPLNEHAAIATLRLYRLLDERLPAPRPVAKP